MEESQTTSDAESLRERVTALERALGAARAQLRQDFDRAKSLDLDLNLASKIHRTLLPQPIRHERIDVDVRYIPFEKVGGDYCQIRVVDEDACYITMCDVVGHGVQGALLATRVSSEVRHWIREGRSPRDIVQSLNTFIVDYFSETTMLLTFIASRIDLQERRITWSGAGHPSPLLVRADATTVEYLTSQNTMIGVQENCLSDEPEHTLDLQPRDRLIFFTDGLIETMDCEQKQLGMEGLVSLATVAMCVDLFDMADHILEQVDKHGRSADDRTLIVAKIK